MADIDVKLTSLKTSYGHAEPLDLRFEVTNSTSAYVYIVRDRYVRDIDASGVLHLIFGEKTTALPSTYHCFEPPARIRIGAGQRYALDLRVQMPCLATQIGADGIATYARVPFSGPVKVQADWGYSRADFQSFGADPRGEYLAWQQLESSSLASIQISPPSP